jgi:DNA invertase Pin-like site-specific DNA recombinase
MKYGYIRVSSDKQTVENQRFEIEQFCLREGVQIDGWIEETVSGMIMEILSYCMRRGCQVWTIKDAYKTIFEILI